MWKACARSHIKLLSLSLCQSEDSCRQAGRPRENFEISGKVVKELEKVEVDFSVRLPARGGAQVPILPQTGAERGVQGVSNEGAPLLPIRIIPSVYLNHFEV